MKRYNMTASIDFDYRDEGKFWLNTYSVEEEVEAKDLKKAMRQFRDILKEEYGYEISDHALKNGQLCGRGDKLDEMAFKGRTLIVDRSADFCGYARLDIYVAIEEMIPYEKTILAYEGMPLAEDDLERMLC